LLGHYENFPETIHGISRFSHRVSSRKVQQAVVSAFYQLNKEKCWLKEIVCHSSPLRCEVNFEFGVGEKDTFTFLDEEERDRLKNAIEKKTMPFLDFLCVLQYYVVNGPKRRAPLKFDYYLLRFAFDSNYVEFLVSHERGPQRVHIEDLMSFLTKHVKRALADQHSAVLKLESTQTL
jgi:hypothetical protein